MYTKYLEKHVRPFVGHLKAGAVDTEVLDSLYRELRVPGGRSPSCCLRCWRARLPC